MKKIIFAISLMLIAFLLFSCDMGTLGSTPNMGGSGNSNVSSNNNDNNTVESQPSESLKPSFEISASRLVYSYGSESISLSVTDTSLLGDYTIDDVVFICENNDTVGLNIDNGTRTLTGYGAGKVSLRAKCGETYSKNTLTIVCLPDQNIINKRIKDAISSSIYLGAQYDIGLNPQIKDFYTIQGLEEFVKINDLGMLEIIGIKGLSTVLRITDVYGGVIFEDFFIMNKSLMADAVRNTLFENGTIPHINTDITNTMLSQMESLDLSATPIYSEKELNAISYFTSLKYLNLSGSVLSNLSYLAPLKSLEELVIENCEKLISLNNGIDIATSLMMLGSLNKLSICGTFATITRNVYDSITSMVLGGQLSLKVTEDVWLDATSISAYSTTVFLSLSELQAHLSKNEGKIVPAKDCYEAIISAGEDSSSGLMLVNADNLRSIHLYGLSNKYYKTRISTNNDLDLYMYNYNLYIPSGYEGVSSMGTNLSIHAMLGNCSIEGASFEYYTSGGSVVVTGGPNAGIYASSCSLYAKDNATLLIEGGYGWIGENGTPAKDSQSSIKNGSDGGNGANGIYCKTLTILSDGITINGGNGGFGGRGGDGHNKDIFQGGYNGGDGGDGGDGGAAVSCVTFNNPNDYHVTLTPGQGGGGGNGGNGYAAGSNGDPGDDGDSGKPVAYR